MHLMIQKLSAMTRRFSSLSSALISTDDHTNEFNDMVNEETLTPPQADIPCHSSHVFLPTGSKDCDILLQPDLSAEQKWEIILNFYKYNPSAAYKFPTKVEF